MVVDLRAELLLLDDGHLLITAGLALLLRRLVLELAVVHDLAHRRARVGRNLYQVQVGFVSQAKRIFNTHDAHLLSAGSDKPDLGDADALVYAGISADVASSINVYLLPTWLSGNERSPRR
ncbi:hypothetical protein GCM10022231_26560 [Gordonia caeni]|uniref:Secreted protein n=1 Tax=Gordonia caeni TaxID=1007097 RepID=A0ABP7PFC2_9ACTN